MIANAISLASSQIQQRKELSTQPPKLVRESSSSQTDQVLSLDPA
jgi:hypothetical protein